jgi:hypothetical protein
LTATEVHGLKVVDDSPTTSGITDRKGNPVVWEQTRTLLLENGHITYGCVHCEYVSDNPNSVRPHLNRHGKNGDRRTPAAQRAAANAPADLTGVSVVELVRLAQDAAQVAADRDQWRKRALAAERDLKAIRKALGGTAKP